MSIVDPFENHPFPVLDIRQEDLVSLDQKREIDFNAVSNYDLPVELMMENAGLNVSRLVSKIIEPGSHVVIGCGKGNNGGGGLVAARRLRGWGYQVSLDLPENPENFRSLPATQLKRTLAFGVRKNRHKAPDLVVDAYFGFNYHRPMDKRYANSVEWINSLDCPVISVDLPSGVSEATEANDLIVKPDADCVLAAPKTVAFQPEVTGRKFIADLGIPRKAFRDLGIPIGFDFSKGTLFEARLKASSV